MPTNLSTSNPPPLNINCSYNALTNFAWNNYTIYGDVNCSHNQISVLDVKNKNLNSLDCSYNQISSLNFQDRKLLNLSELKVDNNNFSSICKNEFDVFPSTGAISQTVCNNPVLGFDPGFKKFLLSTSDGVCSTVISDINHNCVDLDPDLDNEILQVDLNKVAYIEFSQGSLMNDNFVTTAGINHLVNLKGIDGHVYGSSSNNYGGLGSIDIDGLQNLEYVNLTQFFVNSLKIKNTPVLTSVITGTSHSYGPGQTLFYEFNNCPLLENVSCIKGYLSSLSFQNCPNVKYIDATGNMLSSFDASSLLNLEQLSIGNYKKYESGGIPDIVDFPVNSISTLDLSNHINLTKLHCQKGSLTSLNIENCTMLQLVNCSNNQLNSLQLQGTIMNYLPTTPFDFEYNGNFNGANLDCSNNNLQTLDLNNAQITSLKSDNNQLNSMFLKNGVQETITFSNNPNLQFICVDDNQLSNIQTIVDQYGYTTTCNVNTYCSFVPGGNYNTITGAVRFDENNNGCDTNDEFFEHMKLKINDGTSTGETFVKNDGTYDFYTQAGNFTVTSEPENPTLFTVTPSTFSTSFPNNNNNIFTQNICVTKNGNANDLEVVIAPVTNATSGFDAKYKLMWRNKGNTTLSGNVTLTFDSSKMTFMSSVLPYASIVGNQVTFNFSNLKPYANTASEIIFKINTPTHPTNPVNSGDILNFSAIVNPLVGDFKPEDNSFSYKQTVVNSFDPNDIVCMEGNSIPQSMVGKFLHYIVNFENTGTAPATNIVVEMDIDPNDFDISTLQLQNASHQVYTRVKNNKVEFIMEYANLGNGGHGNILMKMLSRNTLASGDNVSNKANIYFDYNFPIVTNDAVTTVESSSVLQTTEAKIDNSITIFPIPTKGEVNISANSKISSVEIYDAQGRIIQKQMGINSQNTKLTIRSNSSGVFSLIVNTEKGKLLKKVIKN